MSTSAKASSIEELDYNSYESRQRSEITPEAIRQRLKQAAIGNRAHWDGTWSPAPYKGFAFQAMVNGASNNAPLSIDLGEIQNEAISLIKRPGVLYKLPAASFHQTVANTFSANRLQDNITNKGLLEDFPKILAEAIEDLPPSDSEEAPMMRMIGISVFRTAFGILGVFPRQDDFNRIIGFRDRLYSHPKLSQLGLRRTRPFIGHITLGYIEDLPNEEEAHKFADGLSSINEKTAEQQLLFHMPKAELHSYETLSRFDPNPTFPKYKL